jgi:hypothetical protein
VAALADVFTRIRPEMAGFRAEAEKGIAGAKLGQLGEAHGKAFGDSFGSGMSAQLKRLGPGLAAAVGGFGLFEVLKRTVGGASDLNETISKSNVVFGDFAGTVRKAFADAPKSLGQTTQAATEAAATLGNLFVSMKIGQPQAAKMSVTMVKLASDLASFNNASPEDALTAIRAGLVGETEPLRRFGVNLNEASLKAEAMRLGLGPIGPTLTALQRTQAAYSLILAQTTTAQGDFARTSTGAANQQRILQAQLEQTATSVGKVVLPAYQGMLTAVNAIGPGTIVAAGAVALLSNRLAASGAGAKVFGDLRAAHQLYADAVSAGAPRIQTALATSGAALTGLKSAASSVVGLFGGPWGLALTAATVGVGLFSQAAAQERATVEALARSLDVLAGAYEKTHNADSTAISDQIAQDAALRKLVETARQYGFTLRDVAGAVAGEQGTEEAIVDALKRKRAEVDKQANSTLANNDALVKQRAALDEQIAALQKAADEHRDVTKAQQEAAAEAASLAAGTRQLSDQELELAGILDQANTKITTSAQLADALKAAYERLSSSGITLNEAEEHLAATSDTLALAVKTAADQHDKNARSLDMNTASGRTNRDNLEALIQATNDMYFAEVQSGVGVQEATRHHEERIDAVRREADKVGLNTGKTNELIATYGRVPTDVNTNVKLSGAQAVFQQLKDMMVAQLALQQGIDIAQANKEFRNQGGQGFGGLAAGGPVEGPGTGTSDSIAVRLSAGEHVVTAEEVRAAGGHQVIEAFRKALLGNKSPRVRMPGDGSEGIAFATGGAVLWPFPVDASHTKVPAVQALGNALATQAFIRGQAGKPYVWAAAGPFGYDCSGIVAAAWNMLHGQSPYSHTFSTSDEAGYFPLPGVGRLLTAGWSNAGEPGGGSVGHTAARLGGLAFESRGGAGVVVGSGVTPLESFAHIGHYDRGGWLPPGTSIAVNNTGRPEPVGAPSEIRLDAYSIAQIVQGLSARPVRVEVTGPNEWALSVAGTTP